ncbi:MAG: SusC/RagA family TonB-linked outer membrane protein, partial [Prevotella sp.]|nr:SusC/RagA family TonB-linked outer membrane protein [Prevotella sp.]
SQNGVAKYSKYKRYTIRLNSTYNLSKYVTVGENLMVARWNNNIGGFGGDAGVAGNTLRQFAGMPVTQSDGSYSVGKLISGSDASNPMEDIYNSRENDNESWRIFGNGYLEVKPVKGLTLKSNFGYDHSQFDNDNLNRTTYANTIASVSRAFGKGDTWTWTNTANYLGTFGQHTINGLMGVEAINYDYSDFNALRKNFLNEDYNYMVIGAGTGDQSNGGGKASWGLFSLFWKADYNFADRYLFSATLRYDRTSRLGKSNNSGTFPAFSGAWRITEEKFWKKNSVLSDMKLRLAWGQNGNSAIGDYATYTTYSTSNIAGYDLDGTGTKYNEGLAVSNKGTEGLKWETTSQFNVGLDTRWMDGALGFSTDFYVKSTKDMLTQPPVLSAAGPNALQWRNTGSMRNVGIEATLDYRSPMYGDFSWDGSFNIAHYKNKVTKLNDAQTSIGGDIRLIEGQPMGVYYGYVCDGIFQNKEQVANHATQPGAEPGRLIFRDINGDGTITDDDRCIIGDPNPDMSLSLNLDLKWKNFTLSMFFTGDFGFDVVNSMKHLTDFFSYGNAFNNRGASTLDAWTPANTGASVPAVSVVDNNNESRFSTYYIEDGSFFKMKYVKIGYDVPTSFCNKLRMNSINIFAQLENVFTATKYKGLDPELGTGAYGARIDDGPYPRSRTLSIGLNVSL